MCSKHLKREGAPKIWIVPRKRYVWLVRPIPGPHRLEQCVPLQLALRDMLKITKTAKEAKFIIKRGDVKVDGKVRTEPKFPIGIMDVLELSPIKKFYRMLPLKRRLILHEIDSDEAKFKLCRINGKTMIKGGNIQLNLHDGRNLLALIKDPRNPVEDVYETGDTLKIGLPKQEVLAHIAMKKGNIALITWGKYAGKYGEVVEIAREPLCPTLVKIKNKTGDEFATISKYIIMIGEKEPLISLP